MKMVGNCTALAAVLSAKYRRYNASEYNNDTNTSSLPSFLNRNGVLVTMCMRFPSTEALAWWDCSSPRRRRRRQTSTRLSTSWVQQDQTSGFQVIRWPLIRSPPVGLVLDPTVLAASNGSGTSLSSSSLSCLFPVDAATEVRDDHGCGPLSMDARYGSHGYDHETSPWRKWWTRQQIINYKNQQFGPATPWDSIPCRDFFEPAVEQQQQRQQESSNNPRGVPFSLLVDDWMKIQDFPQSESNNTTTTNPNDITVIGDIRRPYHWNYASPEQYAIDQWQHTLGHVICNARQPAPGPNFDGRRKNRTTAQPSSLIYTGPTSWKAPQWHELLRWMQAEQRQHPRLHVWNELLWELPTTTQLETAVQAVVYYQRGRNWREDRLARWEARRQARRWNKPLLVVVAADGNAKNQDIFQCAEVTETELPQQ
eukprot:CAMPEP_0168721880 /NCGR_PEP_ID=MMETSP0724-20121128/2313_1 /TAXON_ID=265536 /ORGANISM="Amphiprora sp., Strain CCMP467" /LENGTH=423 /DNA_ID=CAMNT_0008768541 /DNA_START=6 /DNA_END=1277 /DNA_ORIENTATION=-